jgi:hypothetical protein
MQTYKRVTFFEETSPMRSCNDEFALGACDPRVFSCCRNVGPCCLQILLFNSFSRGGGLLVLLNKKKKKKKTHETNPSTISLVVLLLMGAIL